MAWGYTQNFDALTDGDLNGQDSWSGNTNYDVQTSVTFQGAKAVSSAHNGQVVSRTVTGVTDGLFHYAQRSDSTANCNDVQLSLKSSTTYLAIVRWNTSGNIIRLYGASSETVSAYSANSIS